MERLLNGGERTCPVCGKTFWAYAEHAYKRGSESCPVYFCTWKCLRAYDATHKEVSRRTHGFIQTDQVRELRNKGMQIAAIAWELGCSYHTVAYHLNKIRNEEGLRE